MARILLIEDDLVDQMAIQRMLRRKSKHRLDIAGSLQDALLYLGATNIDLVIADLNLSDGTAFDLLPEFPHLPFIIVSGLNNQETYQKLLDAGASQVLLKDNQLKYIQYLPKLINRILDDAPGQPIEENALSDTAGPTGHSSTPYNLNQLSHSFDHQPRIIAEMIDTFLIQTPENLSQLRQAIRQEDPSQVSFMAHKIKSGYKLMGMERQEYLAGKIEDQAKENPSAFAQLAAWVNQLILDTENIYPLLQEAKSTFKL